MKLSGQEARFLAKGDDAAGILRIGFHACSISHGARTSWSVRHPREAHRRAFPGVWEIAAPGTAFRRGSPLNALDQAASSTLIVTPGEAHGTYIRIR